MKHAAALRERFPLVNELLTTRRAHVVAAAAAVVLATSVFTYVAAIATSTGYVTTYGPVIGGDFVVFDSAADAAWSGDGALLYQPEVLEARLKAAFPARDGSFRLSWQYPPTMLLLLLPFALFPYLASFAAWVGATGALFLAATRVLWNDRLAIFLVIAAPASFQSMITGQTGFLTAALLASAGLFADRRPLLAGIAAGILTVKPQLGLLIPFAFAAAGCWRAFIAAAVTAAVLAAASYFALGAETWSAFFNAVTAHGTRLHSEIFPYEKLVSLYGGATMLGAPASVAMALQALGTLALAIFVTAVWRKTKNSDFRVATLCAAAPLASPYAFYYEIAVFAPAVLVVAKCAAQTGWLRGERPLLAFLWIAPISFPGAGDIPGFPLTFAAAILVLAVTARRVLVAPGAFVPAAVSRDLL